MSTALEVSQGEVEVVDVGAVEALTRAEIDKQITTAKQYPRSIVEVKKSLRDLATSDMETAASCMYKLPRGGKSIEGGSVRFAEMLAYSWGNSRVGARVVAVEPEYVVAQGFFFDLERNVAISFEVKRRITGRDGKRFDADMIGVTGNAACAIAYRNAVLKGVPKPFWQEAYNAAVNVVRGTAKTLKANIDVALDYAVKFGVSEVQVLAALGVKDRASMTGDHLVELRGMLQSIKDGDATIEATFPAEYQAVRARDNRQRDAVYEDGLPVEGTHWAAMTLEIERVFAGGKGMRPAEVFEKALEIAKELGDEIKWTMAPATDYRCFGPRDLVKMREHLRAQHPIEEPKAAEPEPAAPATTLVPKCEFDGCAADAVGISPAGTWCAEHMPAGDEASDGPALEEEPSPAEAAAAEGQRAQEDMDGDVSTLIDLLEKAAKHPRFGRPLASMDAVKKGGPPIGLWMKNAEIQKAHGIFRTTLLTEEGEQRVEPGLCRKYVKWLREALAAK